MGGKPAGAGFTLIELLVTMAVLTIVISVGVPMYGSFTQGSAVSSRTSELVAALNLARSEAVSLRTTVRLAALSNSGVWTSGWQVSNVATATVLRTAALTDSMAAIRETANRTALRFDREGRVLADDGTFVDAAFTVCPPAPAAVGAGRRVTLSRFGRVQVAISVAADCP